VCDVGIDAVGVDEQIPVGEDVDALLMPLRTTRRGTGLKFRDWPHRLRQPERPREQVFRQPAWPQQLRMQTSNPLLQSPAQSALAVAVNRLTAANTTKII
jgi:hypothetical protein